MKGDCKNKISDFHLILFDQNCPFFGVEWFVKEISTRSKQGAEGWSDPTAVRLDKQSLRINKFF